MRKLYFAQMADILPMSNKEVDKDIKINLKDNENDKVFDYIYAPDPISGLPQSALGVYLSDKESPVVREFIKSQLMGQESSPVPDGVTDADLETLARGRYETLEEYTNKVNDYVKGIKKSVQVKIEDLKKETEDRKEA